MTLQALLTARNLAAIIFRPQARPWSTTSALGNGGGRLVTLVGEPGIGKTRTAQELATYAGLRRIAAPMLFYAVR